ncbi:MAG: Ig-like domain repeat protein [Burkholderiales bacterium]
MTRLSFWCALFALCFASQVFAATVTVTSTDDTVVAGDGKVTLREAITAVNAGNDLGDPDITAQNPGVFGTNDTIDFNIAGAGIHLITTTSSLLPINRTVFINGYSQPGASPNTNAFNAGINAVLLIEIGGVPGGAVLDILASGTVVRGLAIHGGTNIVAASDVVIAGNFLGTDAAGTTALGVISSGYCVQVVSFGSTIPSNVIIGGPAAADRNLIVSSGVGVQLPFVSPGPGTGYVIQGNYIGTDVTGTLALARGDGMDAISNALVSGNLISGNPLGAIQQLLDNATVQGNLIGVQRDGVSPLPNGNSGIDIHGGNSIIGGAGAGEPNVIANNAGHGVVIYNAQTQGSSNINTRNRISHNSIYANGLLGISLDDSSFVLANDAGDTDTWAANNVGNDGQNYPVITSAAVSGGNATVAGSLNSIANSAFTLEFFANAACDASGYGEGQTFIGTTTVTTDASGNASFGPLNFPAPTGQSVITSTATDAAGNTSEFSQCLVAGGGGPAPTATAVISSLNPSAFGQSVAFTATVSGGASPTGSVQFKDGATNLGAAVALSGATATLTTSALGVGTHPITATYSGDANNSGSASPVLNQVVTGTGPAATTTSLVSSLNPSLVGQAVTFTATVNGGANPTGSVQFNDGAAALANANLSGNIASFTTSALTLGSHPITATYSGDAANAASTSPLLTQVVTAGGTGSRPQPAPTLSQWMLLVLLGALGAVALRRLATRR